jgi:hypothetical protein
LLATAAGVPLPEASADLFNRMIIEMMKSNPKQAFDLLAVREKEVIGRPAKLSKATAMLKMSTSDELLPQFRNFTSPQQIFDEVLGWEIELRMCTIPLLKQKLQFLKWPVNESPRDFFYMAKGYVEELSLAGVVMSEWEAVGQMLAACTHPRFMYVRGYYSSVPATDLKFLEVVKRFNLADASNMLLPQNDPHCPAYAKPPPTPHAPAYVADVFPPAGGRGAGGCGDGGRGRQGRGRGGAFGGAGGDSKGQRRCTHCDDRPPCGYVLQTPS